MFRLRAMAVIVAVVLGSAVVVPSVQAEYPDTDRFADQVTNAQQLIWRNGPVGDRDAYRVVADQAGRSTAVWTALDPTANSAADRYFLWSSHAPRAGAWGVVTRLDAVPDETMGFDLAVDASGTVSVVWTSEGRVLASSRRVGGSWSAAADLGLGTRARFAAASAAEALIFWESDATLQLRQLDAGSGAWLTMTSITVPKDPVSNYRYLLQPAVADRRAQGEGIVAVWSAPWEYTHAAYAARLVDQEWQSIGARVLLRQSTLIPGIGVDAHGTVSVLAVHWGVETLISWGRNGPVERPMPDHPAGEPLIAMAGDGEVISAWEDRDSIVTAVLGAETWQEPEVVFDGRRRDGSIASVAVTPISGRWLVSWTRSRWDYSELAIEMAVRDTSGVWRSDSFYSCPRISAAAFGGDNALTLVGGCPGRGLWGWRSDVDPPTTWMTGFGSPLVVHAPLGLQASASATDGPFGVGVERYEFVQRSRGMSGGWTPWTRYSTVYAHGDPVSGSGTPRAVPGRTYCVRARAIDFRGIGGALSANESCFAMPIDDRQLQRSRGWRQAGGSAWMASVVTSVRKGATLTLPRVTARRFALLVNAMPRGGTVEVRFRGRLLKRVRLVGQYMSSGDYRLVNLGLLPTVQTGSLVIKVVSGRRRPVQIVAVHATAL